MELNHRSLFVGQESLPLDHGTVHSSGLTGNRTDFKLAELVSSCWTMSPFMRKPWDSNPQVAFATDCFQDSVLIRPGDFRSSCGSWNRTNITTFRASDPTVRRSRNCSFSSGGRNRTYGLLIQSQASLPTATTPEWVCISRVPCGS